ncbi:hypothetical protein QL996_11760 [Planococcus sp. APC 4015]|nr:hypothetical protein [Planococcus sp. APC 4015]
MTDSPASRVALPTWLIATIAGFFGLFYAYVVWAAVDLLVLRAADLLGLNAIGWSVLLVGVVFPLVVFASAFAIGWRRRGWQFSLILFAGLCLTAVFWLNVFAYSATSPVLYGS